MSKTVYSIYGDGGFVKLTVSAALAAAVDTLTTPEAIDLSSCVEKLEQVTEEESEVSQDWVVGDNDPIVDVSEKRGMERYRVTLFYTQGKEELGTDALDPYSDLVRAIREQAPAVSVPHSWSIGGASGQEQEATDTNKTFITKISKPVFGKEKVRVTYEFVCPPTTKSVIA